MDATETKTELDPSRIHDNGPHDCYENAVRVQSETGSGWECSVCHRLLQED